MIQQSNPSSTSPRVRPLVSVVITTYNAASTLEETLLSILSQTYSPIDIIVVDDGSKDDTREIVQSVAPSAIYIYQENQGQPSARNTGIQASKGDYIAFVDADDAWLPEKVERQVRALQESPSCGWVYCDALYCKEELNEVSYRLSKVSKPFEGNILENLLVHNFICSATPMMKKEIFADIGLWDPNRRLCEDLGMWLRIASRFRIAYVPEALAKHRMSANSLSSSWSAEPLLKAHLELFDLARLNNPSISSKTIKKAIANTHRKIAFKMIKDGKPIQGLKIILRSPLHPLCILPFLLGLIGTITPHNMLSTALMFYHHARQRKV